MWLVLAGYIGVAIVCGRMIAAENLRRTPGSRVRSVSVAALAVVWLPVLIYCSVALAVDAAFARLR